MSVAQKFREQFLAAVILNLANEGNEQLMWEFVAQMISSFVESSGASDNGAMLAGVFNDISNKVAGHLNEGGIWPELMPGPVRDDQHHDYLMFKVGSMMTESVSLDLKGMVRYRDLAVERLVQDERGNIEVYGRDLDGNECWILLHTTPVLSEVLDDMLKKPGNIKLDYRVVLHRDIDDEGEAYYAHGAEFFVDEHGLQWVKFVAENGYHRGKEHMWRTDCDGFAITKS